jgi:hypothetical protein
MARVALLVVLESSWWILFALASNAAPILRSEKLTAAQPDAEFHLKIRARAPGTRWEREQYPCALLKIVVDDHYDQHVFLVGGEQEMDYSIGVGPLAQGDHLLRIEWDNCWTPALQNGPEILDVHSAPLNRTDPGQEPLFRAPILYIRRDTVGRFTDVPLVLYWERQQAELIYTVIFSNEDGGTDTERLMARWGRTTDIEWCYSYTGGNSGGERFQGRDHQTLPFRGRKIGAHPILYNVTSNNNFADASSDDLEIRVRLLPVVAHLAGRAREAVMDTFPWTYAIMAQEMARERKLEQPADPETGAVSQLGNYAYLEMCSEQRQTELYFQLQLKNLSTWFSSDHGDPRSDIGRSGCVRSTIELPEGTRPGDLQALRICCREVAAPEGENRADSAGVKIKSVTRLFLLNARYEPGPNLLDIELNRSLKPGQSLTIPISKDHRNDAVAQRPVQSGIAVSEVK